jgi:16S rRNA processing protein RimM
MADASVDGEKICLGAIASPHGVRGMVRIKPFTEHPQDIASYGPVHLADGRQFELNIHGANKGLVLVKLQGVMSRDDAEALKGERIYVMRTELPQADADEVYQTDLIGLDLFDPDEGQIGRITAVYDFGAGAMFEIKPLKGKPVMVPFGGVNPIRVDDEGVHLKIDPAWLNDESEPDGNT